MSREYAGRVVHMIYGDDAQAFYIVKMNLEGFDKLISVKGSIPGITVDVGTYFAFKGSEPRFEERARGEQIQIHQAPIIQKGWTTDSAKAALSSRKVPTAILTMLEMEAGDKFVEYLNNPALLSTVSNLSVDEQEHLLTEWRRTVLQFETVDALSKLGIPAKKIDQVRRTFPDDEVISILTQNPWRLIEIEGFDFSACDAVAMKLGLPCTVENEFRMKGATLYAARNSMTMGHTYLTIPEVVAGVRKVEKAAGVRQVVGGVGHLHNDSLLVCDRKTNPEVKATYLPWAFEAESGSALLLAAKMVEADLESSPSDSYKRGLLGITDSEPLPERSLLEICQEKIEVHQNVSGIDLSEDQCQGVLNGLLEPVSIITGLPGTGKSTSLKMLVDILKDAHQNVLLVAPTGIAAKRMAQVTGQSSETIHRAMQARGGKDRDRESTYAGIVGSSSKKDKDLSGEATYWGRGEENPHEADVIIVDEASMVDQQTLFMLLRGTRKSSRIVFVGDAAQLPSVGPGNVLKDMINSHAFKSVHLSQIFRQAHTSDIVRAAHSIYGGVCPNYPDSKEWKFLEAGTESKAQDVILRLATRLYNRRRNFQILSPKHRGDAGVTELNRQLRELLNPAASTKSEFRIGNEHVRVGDRVMIVRNDYELGVFNGDTGKIEGIGKDADGKFIQVKIHGPPIQSVRIPTVDAPHLIRMAYAITVHKSQGQEFDEIVIPVLDSQGRMLQRNLLYTAITRAKKRVFLVGTSSAIVKAVRNDTQDHRNTMFDLRLRKLLLDVEEAS